MKPAGLRGPFVLDDVVIDREVTPRRPGAFVLTGSTNYTSGDARVGRSDTDVNNQLHVYVGSYRYFSFEYCASAQEAFEAEDRVRLGYASR